MFINMSERTQIPLGFNVFELFFARRSHLKSEFLPSMFHNCGGVGSLCRGSIGL